MTAFKDSHVPNDGDRGFPVAVNDVQFRSAEPVLDGRRILDAGGCRPAEDHVLVQLLFPGTRSVRVQESVDLRGRGSAAFRAFRSDRVFRFTIDGRGYEWGAARISESDLRRLATVAADRTLVLERGGERIHLEADATIELSEAGTERLRVVSLVSVTLNDEDPKKIPTGVYTTDELVRVLGVEAGYVLNLLDEQGKLSPLQPGQTICIEVDIRFYSHVPAGGSS